FDPFDLDVTVTPASTLKTLQEKDYLKALCMAFRLNAASLIQRVFLGIPPRDIGLVARELPKVYLSRLLRFVAKQTEEGPHLEFCLLWIEAVLANHGRYLRDNQGQYAEEMRAINRAVQRIQRELGRLADENVYAVEYLLSRPVKKREIDGTSKLMLEDGVNGDVVSGSGEVDGMDEDEGEWMGLE
ncbi:hypothetical protein LTS18_001395, partial [Coniosporium uncinatum]